MNKRLHKWYTQKRLKTFRVFILLFLNFDLAVNEVAVHSTVWSFIDRLRAFHHFPDLRFTRWLFLLLLLTSVIL